MPDDHTEANGHDRAFIVIGENIHTTRVLRLDGPELGADDEGREAIVFTDRAGQPRALPIPEAEKEVQAYLEGRAKHVRIAVQVAMAEGEDAEVALAYLDTVIGRQVDAGSHFLDINVDEVSHRLPEQIATMRWLVSHVRSRTETPIAIDSSNLEIIASGFDALGDATGRGMLNSASLERLEALDVAAAHGCAVVVTAAGEAGMPSDTDQRVANASRMVEAALAKGIPLGKLYVDPLVFPISVDGDFGNHVLEAFRGLRGRYGPEIHLTGGMSNVSFGLPNRKLINDAFLVLAIEAGADSGIIDPVTSRPQDLALFDRSSRPAQLAIDVLSGADRNCRAYLKAFRAGELG
ncbi:MAG: dihydropteroate synthase [Gaiellales bacterium]